MNAEMDYIIEKVSELYIKYGIKSITMDDVAIELGISKKTLYQHVSDKDDLVGKFIDNEINIRKDQICKCMRAENNAVEEFIEISASMNKIIRNQNPATEHDLKKYYPHHFQKIEKVRREGIYSYILLNLKKGKEEGLYRKELNDETIGKLYLSRVESIHMNNLFTIEEFTSRKLFLELLAYHIRGISTQKGIVVFEKLIKDYDTSKENS